MDTYRFGLALSGGGARGIAHLGVLEALNEKGLFPDVIAGTSAGALFGALYADGNSPKQILSFFKEKAFREFAEFTIPQGGFLKNTGLQSFLKKYMKARTFGDLKLPLRVVATDIELGEIRVFTSGSLVLPIVASCSIPIVFKPIEIENHFYVDGGLFKSLPVSVIRKDCYKVMGVNVSPLTPSTYKNSLKYVAERTFHYMSVSNAILDRKQCDYLIESPELSSYSMFDLDHTEEIYQQGYTFAMKYMEENKELLKADFPQFKL